MARNGTAAQRSWSGSHASPYDPRQVWATSVAPLITAAREAAAHAARTASQERARARREESPWWRQRWVAMTVAGVAAAGTAAGVSAVLIRRRSANRAMGVDVNREPGGGPSGSAGPGAGGAGGIRSTVEAGRDKVASAARTVIHKVRRNDGALEPAKSGAESRAATGDGRHEFPTAGSRYRPPA